MVSRLVDLDEYPHISIKTHQDNWFVYSSSILEDVVLLHLDHDRPPWPPPVSLARSSSLTAWMLSSSKEISASTRRSFSCNSFSYSSSERTLTGLHLELSQEFRPWISLFTACFRESARLYIFCPRAPTIANTTAPGTTFFLPPKKHQLSV